MPGLGDAATADEVTILFLFVDIVFTPRASQSPPHEVVRYLNRVFSQFDRLAEKYRLEKIKTIGDAYMVAGGMPDPQLATLPTSPTWRWRFWTDT